MYAIKDTLLYRVIGYSPPAKAMTLSGYGFSVNLDGDYARRCVNKKRPEGFDEKLNEFGKNVLRSLWNGMEHIRTPYVFLEDTMLLRFCSAPGNACDLGIDGIDLDRIDRDETVSYHPHNVDSHVQAYALLSVWIMWFDYSLTLVDNKA